MNYLVGTIFFSLACLVPIGGTPHAGSYPTNSAALFSFSVKVHSNEWTLRKDKEGIKIFTREASETNIKEVKTLLTINAPVDKIINAIINVENYPNWMKNISNPKVLKRVSENEFYLYYEMEVPWPANNRDIVNRTIVSYNPSKRTTLISSTAVPDYLERKEEIVRIVLSNGSWELKELQKGNVEITHILLASPGGNIPDWVINMFIVNHPYETHLNLRKMLEMKG